MATREQCEKKLRKMTFAEFKVFIKDFGGDISDSPHKSDDASRDKAHGQTSEQPYTEADYKPEGHNPPVRSTSACTRGCSWCRRLVHRTSSRKNAL